MKQTRLSMKLLRKLHVEWIKDVLKDDGSLAFVSTEDFLQFVEQKVKSKV